MSLGGSGRNVQLGLASPVEVSRQPLQSRNSFQSVPYVLQLLGHSLFVGSRDTCYVLNLIYHCLQVAILLRSCGELLLCSRKDLVYVVNVLSEKQLSSTLKQTLFVTKPPHMRGNLLPNVVDVTLHHVQRSFVVECDAVPYKGQFFTLTRTAEQTSTHQGEFLGAFHS